MSCDDLITMIQPITWHARHLTPPKLLPGKDGLGQLNSVSPFNMTALTLACERKLTQTQAKHANSYQPYQRIEPKASCCEATVSPTCVNQQQNI